ncbi:MAG TPA: acyltransferase [Sulfuricurvum sp.]|nr:acyltransferase [Sulfuricurvum sp.]
MFSFTLYSRAIKYLQRLWFASLFAHSFKYFGKKVAILNPDIIEGARYISLGDYVSINSKVWLLALQQDNITPQLIIKERTTIGRFAHIVAIRNIIIGKNVLIADKVYISDNLHAYEDITRAIMDQPIVFKKCVEIGENSWIGENVSVIGASIGKHCVIGANSVVTHDIPDYSVAVGAPARVIKRYNSTTHQWIPIEQESTYE